MGITDFLTERSRPRRTDRQRGTGYVTERVETGAKTVSELSTRIRTAATERAPDHVDRRVTEARERVWDRADEEVRKRLIEPLTDEVCEQLFDRRPADLRDESGTYPDLDEQLDRALDAFVRKYDLDADRLDDDTLEVVKEQIARKAETKLVDLIEDIDSDENGNFDENPGFDGNPDFDGNRNYDRNPGCNESTRSGEAVGSRSSADGSPRAPDASDFRELASQIGDDLDVDTDQPLRDVLDDVLQQDVAVVGHAIERALTERAPKVVTAHAIEATREAAQSGSVDIPSVDIAETPECGESVGAAAVAVAVMALLSDDAPIDRFPVDGLSTIPSNLVDGEGGVSNRLLFELLVNALAASDGGVDLVSGVDLSSLGSKSTGSKALIGLFVANLVAMTIGAWISRENAPPIPDEIHGPDGETVVTGEQVRSGKKAFQANGFMNHGSILGNGSYFGVDLTADALELKVEFMREYYARERGVESFDALGADGRAVVAERVERELDAEAPDGSIARYSAAEVYAHRRIRALYADRYHGGAPERGVPQGFVGSPEQAARLADFACWTAWMAHTNRPRSSHSYTNDWPYVPGAGNRPTGQVLVWSTISVVLLIAGGGAGMWAYNELDLAEPTTEVVDIPSPDAVSITPTQYVAAWYVPVAGALFVAQALVGALLAHYYVERTGFYGIGEALGIDIVSLLPFSIGRTWHVNLAVLWISTLWLAGGLFLPGLFADDDPPWQAEGATVLLGALVATTVGAFAGVWFGMQGKFGTPDEGELWWWFGSEGLEYLETGRFWKLLLLGALGGWTGLVLRSVRRLDEPPTGLGHFMTYAGGSIALMFGASMLYTPETNIAVTEFWRWWVVHMWVEGVFEFFVTAVISVALVSMDLLDQADAETAILFEVFTIMAAGIVGVSHHYWWVGLPDIWVPIGTTFSTLEFVPLVFILYRSLGEYRSMKAQGEAFPYTLPLLFIVGSSLWNFVGGGVLGFFINLPVINYYEHGTYLTVAHGHTATFGAFGLLALGLGTYVLRVVTPEDAWEPSWFRGAFWLSNVGLVLMTVASLLPIGFVQLRTSYQDGYAEARSLDFYEQPHVQTMLWARTLGDTPMILGALAFTAGAVRHLLASRRHHLASRGHPLAEG